MASTQIDIRWKCRQEEGSHQAGQQVLAGLWWPEGLLYCSAYRCLCQFFKAIQASYWCLWHGLRSCPQPDLGGWYWSCHSLCQYNLEQGWVPLPSSQVGSFSPSSGQWLRNSTNTCLGWPSMSTWIIICSCMFWPLPSWMQPAIAGLPAWPTTILDCTIGLAKPI